MARSRLLLLARSCQGPAGLHGLVAALVLLPAGTDFVPAGLRQLPAATSQRPAGTTLQVSGSDPAIERRPVDGGSQASHGASLQRPACEAASTTRPIPLPTGALLQPSHGLTDADPRSDDYHQQLASTALGWPRLDHWCVWLEPASSAGPAALWEQRWWQATRQALQHWQRILPIDLVEDPAAAQIRIRRQRPPRQQGADGRLRASHGRTSLQLLEVSRSGLARPEPSVEVLISPDQRPLAIEATALHELGHAFGLWGHSERSEDAMAAIPGAVPVLELSRRDQATVRWLYGQPTRFGPGPGQGAEPGSGAAISP